MPLDLFKLEKLKISAFKDAARSNAHLEFEAMFNPTSYSRTYSNKLTQQGKELQFSRSDPGELSLTLVLDGTGVHEMGLFVFSQETVEERVERFLTVAYAHNGSIHEANYLIVEWGSLKFSCRLSKVDIKYTVFDRDGKPLRAELSVKFLTDEESVRLSKTANNTSPDLTHARVVRSGDTLPALTKEIYGSSARYLDVARFNGLDDFRFLTPGQQLLFPPLDTFEGGASGRG